MSIWEILVDWVGPRLEPITAPVNESFQFFLGPTTNRFDAVKSEVTAEPRAFEWAVAGIFLAFSVALVVVWFYVMLKAVAALIGWFRGKRPSDSRGPK